MARPDHANQALDQGLEFGPRLAVVFVRVERAYLLRPWTGMKTAEPTANAGHHGGGDASDAEPRLRLFTTAHRAGRHTLRRVGGWIEHLDGTFVETCAGQGSPLLWMRPMERAVPGAKGQVEGGVWDCHR